MIYGGFLKEDEGMGSQRLRPRQDSSGTDSSPSDPSQTPTPDSSVPAAPTDDPNASPTGPPPPKDPPPSSDTSVPGSTPPPDAGGSSDPGSTPNPTPTSPSNTGQAPSSGGSNGGQNTRTPNPDPTGANPDNGGDGSLITTNGQTLSIAGGVTVAVSQVITEYNGHVTTVTVPIATLYPTGLTASQRDGIIAGSVLGCFAIGAAIIGFLFYRRRRRIRQQDQVEEELPKPRRLLHSDGPLDLTAGSSNPYVTTAWGSEPHMTQYDTMDSRFPFAMVGAGARGSSPRLSRARTSVSGSIFQEEDIWPPPGEEYWSTPGGNLSGSGPAPPSRTSLDTQGLVEAPLGPNGERSSLPPSISPSPARPFASHDSNAPMHPPSPLPILTSMSPHGFRPSSPTTSASIVSSPISYASGSRLVPSAAAAAKAREATSESSRSRYRTSAFGPTTSGPHSAYSESDYNGPAIAGLGGVVDQAESSPAAAAPFTTAATAAATVDSSGSAAAPRATTTGGPGSSGTMASDRGFGEAINSRLGPMGLGGGPSPGPTPLENEIPPLYSMIRRDTDVSLEGGTTPGRNT